MSATVRASRCRSRRSRPTGRRLAAALPLHGRAVPRMIEAGILTENDRVELLEGLDRCQDDAQPASRRLRRSAQTDALAAACRTDWRRARAVGDHACRQRAGAGRGRRAWRRSPLPDSAIRGPATSRLLIEVADTTLARRPRPQEAALCPRPHPGLLDRQPDRRDQSRSTRNPRAGRSPGYRQRHDYGPDDSVPLDPRRPARSRRIPVRELLPLTAASDCRMIYLDNAATSFPKPEAVYQALDRFARQRPRQPRPGRAQDGPRRRARPRRRPASAQPVLPRRGAGALRLHAQLHRRPQHGLQGRARTTAITSSPPTWNTTASAGRCGRWNWPAASP